jgi:pyridoxamine 5'-phosphate oxidase
MAEELWRPSLDLALHNNRQSTQARFVQLATVRETGHPAVRTVVFRGFLGETYQLTFATDSRSVKAAEIQQSPCVEACWYFHLTR